MAVHDVDMHPVGARRLDAAYLLAQPREIGAEDRGGDPDGGGRVSGPGPALTIKRGVGTVSPARARHAPSIIMRPSQRKLIYSVPSASVSPRSPPHRPRYTSLLSAHLT